MDITEIILEKSPWFILLCILAGAIYSYFLYQKNNTWSKTVNLILAGIRFVLVTILCYLLLVPLIKQTKNLIEKPILVIAMDNSQSMLIKDSLSTKKVLNQLKQDQSKFRAKGFEVDFISFDKKVSELDSNKFNARKTNISSLLKRIRTKYENRNLVSAILVSDGINNYGFSPEYVNVDYPIQVIGVGDTSIANDVFIRNVIANKLAYKGNKYPVRVEFGNKGYKDSKVNITLYVDGIKKDQKTVTISSENGINDVEFLLTANEIGKHQLKAEVNQMEDEWNVRNNLKETYLEVIDGKQKILFYAHSPHPDLKALKNVIEEQQNYDLSIRYENEKTPVNNKENYDLVIFHQIPSAQTNIVELEKNFKNNSKWFITGTQTDFVKLNKVQKVLSFQPKAGQTDNVFPTFNRNNDQFNFSAEHAGMLAQYPPVEVPFGDFKLAENAKVILYQRVGSIDSDKPLLSVAPTDNFKTAVSFGEGIWKWRMMEYAQNENFDAFNALMSKVLQYVGSANDKRKLRVFPISDEFSVDENAQIDIEVYNDIFEPLFDKEITVNLIRDGQTVQYKFVNSETSVNGDENGTRFTLGNLEKGIYNIMASTTISGKRETATASFIVKQSNLEALNTSADFNILRKIAQNNQGEFFNANESEKVSKIFLEGSYPDKIISTFEELKELIHAKWIFFLLLGLATIEWSIRKYNGAI